MILQISVNLLACLLLICGFLNLLYSYLLLLHYWPVLLYLVFIFISSVPIGWLVAEKAVSLMGSEKIFGLLGRYQKLFIVIGVCLLSYYYWVLWLFMLGQT